MVVQTWIFLGFLMLSVGVISEVYAEETKTIFVNSQLMDCVGVGPQKCMQIKYDLDSDWQFFYDRIDGFIFSEGFSYELLVKISDIENPPDDASSKNYELIKIISKNSSSNSNQICIDKVWIENIRGNIACVTPTTAEKLIERGWGTPLEDTTEPLTSWNDGKSKQQIIDFVNKVTDSSLPSFVSPENRIATFDNDGTLWIEQPLYIPFAFHLEYLYEQLEKEPSLASQSPYKEVLEKKDTISNKDLEEIPNLTNILLPAYPGITQSEYLTKSQDYLTNTKHERYDVALKELTYLPMVELVSYLQENDFKVYIVSAGFQGLMRSVSDEIYNIPSENVIGTHPEFVYELSKEGPLIIRQPVLASFDDRAEKPPNIQKFIGKIPIFACGNSGGDIEMLEVIQVHENHLGCMLNHDDEIREYDYPNSEALEASEENDWVVISMKDDFKTIFINLE